MRLSLKWHVNESHFNTTALAVQNCKYKGFAVLTGKRCSTFNYMLVTSCECKLKLRDMSVFQGERHDSATSQSTKIFSQSKVSFEVIATISRSVVYVNLLSGVTY